MKAHRTEPEPTAPESWDAETAWRVLGERSKSRNGAGAAAAGARQSDRDDNSDGSAGASPPVLSSDEAWYMLGTRMVQRLKRSPSKQELSRHIADVESLRNDSPEDAVLSAKLLEDIEKMNCLITISSVAEKAAQSWKTRKEVAVQFAEASGRRPSEGLFDIPLNTHIPRAEARRPSRVHFDLPSQECQTSPRESERSSRNNADVSEVSDGPSYQSSVRRNSSSTTSESSKQPRSTPSISSDGSKKSQRARKRGDSLIPSPSCRQQALEKRRRRFSKQTEAVSAAAGDESKCRSTRRRSSLVFYPRVSDVLSAGARLLSETPANPSIDIVRLAAARRTSLNSSPSRAPGSPPRLPPTPDRSPSTPGSSCATAHRPSFPSFATAARRRSSTVSTPCAVSMFAQDLRDVAAGIPAGDPRIGELYSAAARAFGPPKFIPAPGAAEEQDDDDDDAHPNEQTE